MTAVTRNELRSWRLGRWTRRVVLVTHIVSAGAWIGIDIVMAFMVFTSLLVDDVAIKAICYQALELFVVWPLVVASVVCLASGIILGLGSKYGLIKYWWVAIKLGLNLVLTTLVLLSLRPGVVELAELGRQLAAGESVVASAGDMVYPPIVSTAALLVAMILSVVKPWGRTRKHND